MKIPTEIKYLRLNQLMFPNCLHSTHLLTTEYCIHWRELEMLLVISGLLFGNLLLLFKCIGSENYF